ncbi:cobalt ECF transporter T component CbiQ [Mycolicibacterium sp. S3B2]|uniref:cobalt ECF transporter T component CbiQ n=1 Tax=Mycolicibacterium sp. S3B2 TaxID=3415120 RepID=UPI003C7EA2D1
MGLGAGGIDAVAWRSGWRRRSVAEKTVLLGGVVGLTLVLPPWPTLVLLLALCLGISRSAQVPLTHLGRCLRAPAVFIGLATASTVVAVDTAPWRVSVSDQAVAHSVQLGGRAIVATVAMVLFASTTPMTMVMTSLRRIGVPIACVEVITVMYRMTFILLESIAVTRDAQAARLGYSTAWRAMNSAGLLTAAVLVRAWAQARRLDAGLAGRDFGVPMPVLDAVAVQWRFVAASIAALVGICVLSFSVAVLG